MSKEPRAGKTRTVNLDDWLARKHPPDVGASVRMPSPEQLEDARAAQRELVEGFVRQSAERAREPRLDPVARECADCGRAERHYTGDYICYICRDALESEELES